MAFGSLLGKAAEMLGDNIDIMAKLEEFGIDPTELVGLDADSITGFLEEKGIDLSILETFGLSVEDIIEKVKGA